MTAVPLTGHAGVFLQVLRIGGGRCLGVIVPGVMAATSQNVVRPFLVEGKLWACCSYRRCVPGPRGHEMR